VSYPGELRRQLGLGSAAALVVGEVIGVGIFLTPAAMAKQLGSPLWLLVVWLGMGAVTLAGALCLGELTARLPAAGGGYVYLREAYGPGVAFLFGWMSLLVMDPGLTAALAMGLAGYVGYVVELSDAGVKAVAGGAILVLAAANIIGVRLGAGLLRAFTVLKLGLLAFIVVWGFGRGLGDWSHFTPFGARPAGSPPFAGALAAGVVAAFFSFAGWWDMSKMAGEVRDPARTLPRALVLGVLTVTVAYVAVSAVFLYLVPVAAVTSDETFAAQAGEVLFGRAGGVFFSVVVVVAVFGSLASIVLGAPRVYYAMARDGLFLPGVAAIHPRFGTPARAIAIQAALACGLLLWGTFTQVLAYFFFTAVAFQAVIIAAVIVLRRRSPAPPAYRTPGYPLTPLLFLVPTALFLVLLVLNDPVRAGLGTGVVALGVPVYWLVVRRAEPNAPAREIGRGNQPATYPADVPSAKKGKDL
jgi:APA family basic amino acid/polyamine antiporter